MNNYFEGLKVRANQLVKDTKNSKPKVEAVVNVIVKYVAKFSVILGCASYLAIKGVVFTIREVWRAFKYVVDDIEMAVKENRSPAEITADAKSK